MKNDFVGIDIFSGAGGLSLGAVKAGISIPVAIEKVSNAAKTTTNWQCGISFISRSIFKDKIQY